MSTVVKRSTDYTKLMLVREYAMVASGLLVIPSFILQFLCVVRLGVLDTLG